VKPVLSDKQKRDRVGFALSHMHRKGGARVVVDDMYDWVHVDEKRFYVMKDGRGIYLHPEEDSPKTAKGLEQAIHHQATINAERYKELMTDKVIPAIKARMPRLPGHTIFVQQDGAKPHTGGGGH
ncbi:unnamed protein product, partial [Discosporangium mesarthrocarpum]